jgi:hypothetical protein
MTDCLQKTLVLVLSTLFVLAPASQVAQADEVKGGGYRRLAANTTGFVPGTEIVVLDPATGPPANSGTLIYSKTVLVPDDINVLFITISATGDVGGGAQMLLACLVDKISCVQTKNPVPGVAFAGWVIVQRFKDYNLNYQQSGVPFNGDCSIGLCGAGNLHENSVNYTWCVKIKKQEDHGDIHNVMIKMASQPVPGEAVNGVQFASIVAVHFYIDGAKLPKKDACTTDTSFPPTSKEE